MKTIVQGSSNYQKLLFSPCWTEESGYKPSAFVLRQEIQDGTLLCNTITGEMVLLSPEETSIFDNADNRLGAVALDLMQGGYIVSAKTDEKKRFEQLSAVLLKRQECKKIILHYNILPTTDCNARCFYCYESGIKHTYMSKETADQLVEFIANHHGKQKVLLSWYGGEPTLGKNIIDYICGRMRELNIDYSSNMISNSYLFDEKLIKQAIEGWHLKKIQITLDGTEEVYNRVKAYVGIKESAYNKVIKNIECFLDQGVRVDIRLNMDDHNADNLEVLIDELADRFENKENLIIYIRQLNENVGFAPIKHSEEDRKRLKNRFIDLRNRLGSRGWRHHYYTELPHLQYCKCMADNPYIIQCTPDGLLGKCEDSIFEHTVGTLTEGITNGREINWWREKAYYEGCGECALLPCCTFLLKHCAARPEKCDQYEKEHIINAYRETMVRIYNDWKSNGSQDVIHQQEIDDTDGVQNQNCG